MIINLKDGKFIRIDIKKNEKGIFEYYSEGVLLGVYDPSVMKDDKFLKIDLERNHTLSDEAKDQIRDEINTIVEQIKERVNVLDDNEIEEESEENRALGEYLREIGVDDREFKKVAEIDLVEKKKSNKQTDLQQENNRKEGSDAQERGELSRTWAHQENR